MDDDAKMALRTRAVLATCDGAPQPLARIWQALVRGQYRIEDTLADDRYCYLILSHSPATIAALKPVAQEILERVLRGDRQKQVAIDHQLCNSTIAATAKQALATLGLDCQASKAPLAVVLLAQASRDAGRERGLAARLATFEASRRTLDVVSIRRPDGELDAMLPPAEAEVVRRRLEGHSHQLIAEARQTSQRTVANQLASAARRLGASGRLELIDRLVAGGAVYQPAAMAS